MEKIFATEIQIYKRYEGVTVATEYVFDPKKENDILKLLKKTHDEKMDEALKNSILFTTSRYTDKEGRTTKYTRKSQKYYAIRRNINYVLSIHVIHYRL